ncbi:(R,S)-reticuline 7-O-methyltransferase-like [Argentina anserina]|uniref:(R,S)-reticuline 7-O-methyltransferase-like n=1 Tax=Argentina anserina TaxID=57926 RepID=UPI00217625C2|nr:(R,S)-reticuline 7-O-methyltransferase-like [Potentilla anserina]
MATKPKLKEQEEEAMLLQGQADILHYTYNFVESMALKCAVELGIADIINSQGQPLTVHQITEKIASPAADIDNLSRLMRFLVQKNLFEATTDTKSGDLLYGLTYSSKWLLRSEEQTLAPLVRLATLPSHVASWLCLSQCIKDGGSGFEKANGFSLYDERSGNQRSCFDEAMACISRIVMKAILSNYRDVFDGVGSIVDVGGGIGISVAEIVKSHPHIRGINFDLPDVVATAPTYPGVTHLGGDMFNVIPNGDVIFMKAILHNWSDEKCVTILKNCRRAIHERKGKIIIVDGVLQPDGDRKMDTVVQRYDLTMMAQTPSGKERTEAEWKKLLSEGGFGRHEIIKIPSFLALIEAYPE